MKVRSLFGLFLLACLPYSQIIAQPYHINGDGVRYKPSTYMEIVFGIAATNPPSEMWVYKVQPATFSHSLISNLLDVAGLTMSDKIRPNNILLGEDKEWVRFETVNKFGQPLRMLDFEPEHSFVRFSSSEPSKLLKESPSESETKELGYKFMSVLGITNYNRHPRMMTVNTSSSQTQSNVVTARGVGLSRVIDEFNERGTCLFVEFGNNGKVLHFDMLYRNLVRDKLVNIATTNEVIQFIREGKAKAIIQEGNGDYELLPTATKLTITKFKPLYYSEGGTKKIAYEFPFVELSLVADCGTNKVAFYMDCPLIDESPVGTK